VSFRPGTNVEFRDPGFSPEPNNTDGVAQPVDGYTLENLGNQKRDFSNPMYDAVQSGSTKDPNPGMCLID
jgi:low density lipoprotein-related protein 2